MISRICFLGDSHVAALRQAMDDPRSSSHAGRISIYGARGKGLYSLRREGRKLLSDEEKVGKSLKFTGGTTSIDIDAHDVFCIVGGLVKLEWVDEIVAHYATTAMALPGRHPVSARLLDRMFEERLRKTIAHHLLKILENTGKPLFYIPCPLNSEDILGNKKGDVMREMIAAGLVDDYFGRFCRARDVVLGKRARIIDQPEETKAPPFFTQRAYGIGSVRLAKRHVEHPEDDFGHMNADYGVLMLNAAVKAIDAASRSEFAP